jgi:hypothetical protein
MVLDCQGSPQEQYAAELRFNNAVREVFLNRFVHIFSAYEHFVIHPNQVQKKLMVIEFLNNNLRFAGHGAVAEFSRVDAEL